MLLWVCMLSKIAEEGLLVTVANAVPVFLLCPCHWSSLSNHVTLCDNRSLISCDICPWFNAI